MKRKRQKRYVRKYASSEVLNVVAFGRRLAKKLTRHADFPTHPIRALGPDLQNILRLIIRLS